MTLVRPRRAVAVLIALALAAASVLVGAVTGLTAPIANATSGNQVGKICPHDGEWRKIDGLSGTTYTAEASEGMVIVEVCVKSAQTMDQYEVEPTTSVTIETPSTNDKGGAQDISHVAVREIADDGGWPYPAPTCDATLTVTYPQGVSGNHVNVGVRNLDTEEEVHANLHKPSGAWSGEQTFDLTAADGWPDWPNAAIEWIQVDGNNYHWQGHVELDCDTPPTPTPSEPGTPEPTPSPSEPVETPAAPSLAGSTAVGECLADAPWIGYDVQLTDEAGQITERAAQLVLTDGTESRTLELGELDADGALSGRVLWPGASVAEDGVTPTGWPGWEQLEDGTWVETDGNEAWTRGDITATLVVNPELEVELAYPEATPDCVAAPPSEVPAAEEPTDTVDEQPVGAPVDEASPAPAPVAEGEQLAETGASVWLYAVAALLLVAAGGVVLVLRRRA